jgi:glycosyltransferase involved in cell wall biosynthesis
MTLNVDVVTTYFYPVIGGIENFLFELYSLLSRLYDINVVIHTSAITYHSVSSSKLTSAKAKFSIVRYRPILLESLFLPRIRTEADIVHLHGYSQLMNDIVCRQTTKRLIITPYGTLWYPARFRRTGRLSRLYDLTIGLKTLKRCRYVIALTNFEKKYLESILGNSIDVKIIPIGINFEKIITQHVISNKKFDFDYIFSIGRITSTKNFIEPLYALVHFPQLHFILAGPDKGYLHKLFTVANKLGVLNRFHYIGVIPDQSKYQLMQNAVAFVNPSYAEAFSIVNLEAMAVGSIVFAKQSPVSSELIRNGFNGFTYKNIPDLQHKLELLINNSIDSSEIRTNAKSFAKLFDIKEVAKKTIKLYEELKKRE